MQIILFGMTMTAFVSTIFAVMLVWSVVRLFKSRPTR